MVVGPQGPRGAPGTPGPSVVDVTSADQPDGSVDLTFDLSDGDQLAPVNVSFVGANLLGLNGLTLVGDADEEKLVVTNPNPAAPPFFRVDTLNDAVTMSGPLSVNSNIALGPTISSGDATVTFGQQTPNLQMVMQYSNTTMPTLTLGNIGTPIGAEQATRVKLMNPLTTNPNDPSVSLELESSAGVLKGVQLNGSSLYPITDSDYDLGKSTARFQTVFLVNQPDVASDARLKTDIADTSLGLDFLRLLTPRQYRLKNEAALGQSRTHHGFLAQEVWQALGQLGKDYQDFAGYRDACREPGYQAEDYEDGATLSLAYGEFIAPMVRAVQELAAQLEAAEAENERLAALLVPAPSPAQ